MHEVVADVVVVFLQRLETKYQRQIAEAEVVQQAVEVAPDEFLQR